MAKQIGLALLTAICVTFLFGLTSGLIVGGLMLVVTLISSGNNQKRNERFSLVNGDQKKCPYCAEFIKSKAIVFKYCWRNLSFIPGERS